MLRGVKPLAVFSYSEGFEVDFLLRYLRLFDRHVGEGRLNRRERLTALPGSLNTLHHHLFYTLPGEDWRVDAVIDLLRLDGPWSEERERTYGSLLGYEDWQNDVWLSRVRRHGGG